MRLSSSLAVGLTVLAAASPTAAQTAAQAPFKAGHHYFFIASDGSLAVRNGLEGTARLLLQARAYGTLAPSWDGQYVAYSYGIPADGATSYDVLVLNVSTGGVFPEVLHHARISRMPWTANNQGFFYTREDTAERRERVYYHRVGEPQAHDEIIYSRQDQPDWRYDVRVSDDGQFAILTISHPQDAHTRLYFINLDDPGKPKLNAPTVQLIDDFGARYTFVTNNRNSLFLQTDDSAPRGRIVLASTDPTRAERWPVVWHESPDTLQFARAAGKNYMVAVYRDSAQAMAKVLTFSTPTQTSRSMNSGLGGGLGMLSPRGGSRRGGMGGGRGGGGGQRQRSADEHLQLKGEIQFPPGSTLVDMRSVADDDELFYLLKWSDGALKSYVYNVTNGQNRVFETNMAMH